MGDATDFKGSAVKVSLSLWVEIDQYRSLMFFFL